MTATLEAQVRAGGPRARTRRRLLLTAAAGTIMMVAIALLGPLIAPYDPAERLGLPFQGPDGGHPLGTDFLGRDVLSRVLWGGRALILTAIGATVVATAIGMTAGVLAGLVSRRTGEAMARLVDVLAVLPALLLILVLAAGFPGSDVTVVAAVALATAPFSVRVLGAATRRIVTTGYAETALARGDGRWAVLLHDILPNMAGPALADAALRLVAALHLTATAGFLGLGRGAPAANWGRMVSENLSGASLSVTPLLAPTLLLVLLSVCVGLLTDWFAGIASGGRP
ncbi:ABC transporter permease [Microbispora siamensis]|uniref:Transporter integral membrane protein n=1 Tax=Microbispora siamensis TaxID=564413 RepID=A0ABQ4GT03_9ACTN|nr:ABC transporter permease subunit [Microbispora siamensis]GIH64557.1 transporter integral membrane protein [Microbispora siamensis]